MTAKTHVPNVAIFNSDPEEQIYARGTLDRDMSGLAFMFKNAAQDRRRGSEEAYMDGVRQANMISAALTQQETMSKQAVEMLKQAVEMSKSVGSPTSTMPIMQMLFPSGVNDPGAAAKLDLLRSEAEGNRAKGVNESKPEFSVETAVTPSGVSQEILRAKQKGGDSAMLQEMARQRALQALKQRGIQGSGPGGTGLPNANARDVSATQEYKRGANWGN